MAENLLSVSEAARRLGAKPKDISDLFYNRQLRDDIAPIVAGRRVIPEGYVHVIGDALRRNGRQIAEAQDENAEMVKAWRDVLKAARATRNAEAEARAVAALREYGVPVDEPSEPEGAFGAE